MPIRPYYLIAISGAAAVSMPAIANDAGGTAWLNRQMSALAERASSTGWNVTASGLRWRRVLGDGGGPHPKLDDEVSVNYVGSFADGRVFDSSIERGEPTTFPLFLVIQGWQEGLQLMGVGDKVEFAVPSQLAYGTSGNVTIPSAATLLFTVELVAVKPYAP